MMISHPIIFVRVSDKTMGRTPGLSDESLARGTRTDDDKLV